MKKSNGLSRVEEKTPCAICGRMNDLAFLTVRDPIKQNQMPHTLVRCSECGLIYLNPRQGVEGGLESHPAEYWERKNLFYQIEEPARTSTLKNALLRLFFAEEIRHIKKNIPPNGRILEVGFGNGDFLRLLKNIGYHSVGIEADPASFGVAKKKHPHLELYNTSIENTAFKTGTFDAVIMIHVLEHLRNPNEALGEIRRILSDNGSLFIWAPNIDCYQFRIFRERYFNLCAPQHMYQYTPETLRRLLEKNGFKKVRMSHQSIRSNSATLVCSLFPGLNPVSLALKSGEAFSSAKRILAHILAAFFIPFTALEGFLGHGANMFVLAVKDRT
jgi:ubiquinone/menaquinone biosynthesis C-methylase UbiE